MGKRTIDVRYAMTPSGLDEVWSYASTIAHPTPEMVC